MQSIISLTAFYDRLIRHDWFHEYADDFSAWEAGNTEQTALETAAGASPEHRALYTAVRAWKMDRGPAVARPELRVAA